MASSDGQEIYYADEFKSVVNNVTNTTEKVYDEETYNLLGIKFNGSEKISYVYNEDSKLTKKTLNLTNPLETTYTYLNADSYVITSVQNGSDVINYTYDKLGNITRITSGTDTVKYTYDSIGQLIREDNSAANKTYTYEYDAGGNCTAKKTYAYTEDSLTGITPTSTTTYTYDSVWKDKLVKINGVDVTSDALGNITSMNGNTFTWSGRELASASVNDKDLAFKYNAEGIRTEKAVTVGGVTETIRYYLDGTKILTQIGNQRLDFFYDENDSVVAFKYNGNMYYYLKNLQGDIYAIVDSTGAKVAQYTYDAWGNVLTVKDGNGTAVSASDKTHIANLNPFRYRGYYYDTESNIYYLQSRYYDPTLGRFVNADEPEMTVFAGGINLGHNIYIYCVNNPVNKTDPSGMYFIINYTSGEAYDNINYSYVIQITADWGRKGYNYGIYTSKSMFYAFLEKYNLKYLNSMYTIGEKIKYINAFSSISDKQITKSQILTLNTVDLIARCIYSEDSLHYDGQLAVAYCIYYRLKKNSTAYYSTTYGNNYKGVILKSNAFEGIQSGHNNVLKPSINSKYWKNAKELAIMLYNGSINRLKKPSGYTNQLFFLKNSYFNKHYTKQSDGTYIHKTKSVGAWNYRAKNVVKIGGNTFYTSSTK